MMPPIFLSSFAAFHKFFERKIYPGCIASPVKVSRQTTDIHCWYNDKAPTMKRFYVAVISVLLISILETPVSGYDLRFAWDPISEPDLAGYVLYVRENESEGTFEQVGYYPLDQLDPNNPQGAATDLENDTTYYFAVTAINRDGVESDYSNLVGVLNNEVIGENTDNDGSGSGCFISTAGAFGVKTPR
jgi:hypothetical protein